jgi:hypothetical protein
MREDLFKALYFKLLKFRILKIHLKIRTTCNCGQVDHGLCVRIGHDKRDWQEGGCEYLFGLEEY